LELALSQRCSPAESSLEIVATCPELHQPILHSGTNPVNSQIHYNLVPACKLFKHCNQPRL